MAENADTMDALDQPIQKKSPMMLIIMLVNLLMPVCKAMLKREITV